MACLLLSSNMAPLFAASQLWPPLFSREGKGDLCFQLRPILLAPVIIVISTTAFGVFFFIWCMIWGNNFGARAFRRANLCLFSVEVFPFLFRSWQIFLVSASAIFSIGLTIFTSFPTWKKYQGRKCATASRRPFRKVIWSNFRIWFSSFYLWYSKTPSS